MSIRLVAIDLDYTLLNNKLEIPDAARDAIQAAVKRGTTITLASGRMYRSTVRFAEELGLDVPLITYNGAMTKSSRSRQLYHHLPVPFDLALDVIRYAKQEGIHINIYLDDNLYVEKLSPEAIGYATRSGVEATPVGDLTEFLKADPTKLLFVADEKVIDKHIPVVKERFGDKLNVVRSMPIYIEVTNKGVSKGTALKSLAAQLGIPREEVLAIGDSENDLDMIEYAGTGVAVANAVDIVRDRANYVTAHPNGRGVAEALDRFVL
ncbi:MAG TPA: HAD family phosphatase [Firmicutes bacterium]|nr:HAD family phosphatase [Bacillota bacterium]